MNGTRPGNTAIVEEQYDVKAGRWPSAYNECVVVLTANGTVPDLVSYALGLRDQANRLLGRLLPAVLMLNKCDMAAEWEVPPERIRELSALLPVFSTSARTGEGVEEAFDALALQLASPGSGLSLA